MSSRVVGNALEMTLYVTGWHNAISLWTSFYVVSYGKVETKLECDPLCNNGNYVANSYFGVTYMDRKARH